MGSLYKPLLACRDFARRVRVSLRVRVVIVGLLRRNCLFEGWILSSAISCMTGALLFLGSDSCMKMLPHLFLAMMVPSVCLLLGVVNDTFSPGWYVVPCAVIPRACVRLSCRVKMSFRLMRMVLRRFCFLLGD